MIDQQYIDHLRTRKSDKQILSERANIVRSQMNNIQSIIRTENINQALVEFGKLDYNITALCDIIKVMTDNLPTEEVLSEDKSH